MFGERGWIFELKVWCFKLEYLEYNVIVKIRKNLIIIEWLR
jgi:hypothetical protein